MPSFFERHSQNAIAAALLASVIAVVIGVASLYLTVHYNKVSQDRQARLEQVAKFDQSTQQIIDAAQSFVSSINDNNKGLDPAKVKLRTVIASEINETDNITRFLDKSARDRGEQYQTALQELNDVAQKTSGITDMRPWAESFGRVLDNKALLSRELYTELGIDTQS
jgi:uncharacterized membrane-anchored protein YhcB (DUF1043 family)